FQPMDLRLDHAALWPGGIAVLGSSAVPPALLALHERLGQALQAAGVPPERRPLRAHVTLARQAQGAVPPPPGEPVSWRAERYVLVESDTRPPTQYRVVASWA
ncbi:MAG TPA: 2'-5' RNA ligase family protein, partial [Albitalea sp.]